MIHITKKPKQIEVVNPRKWQFTINLETGDVNRVNGKPFPDDEELTKTLSFIESLRSAINEKDSKERDGISWLESV